MSTVGRPHREILRYFYSLLVVGGISAALLVTTLYLGFVTEVRERSRLERFHIRSIILTAEAAQALSDFQGELVEAAAAPPATARRARMELALGSIGRSLEEITAMQLAAGDAAFEGTIDRANRQYAALLRSFEGADRLPEQLRRDIVALDLTLFQFDRLHTIAAETMLHDVGLYKSRRFQLIVWAFVSVLLVTGALVWRIRLLLQASLRRQAQTEADLRQREQLLHQSSKMEALGTLVGGVAHDFNNLLTAILANAEILQWQLEPGDPRGEDLQGIIKAGERAATLTRQLLAFSRQERIEPSVIDLNLLLRDTESILRRLLPSQISLELDCGEALPDIEVDAVQLEQVIVNLAVNARDAMPEGGFLAIRTRQVYVDGADQRMASVPVGSYARITVEDNGCGMDEATLARAFDPFFTTKHPGQGTGLGLSTVHGIVMQSNGHITVASTPGQGTRFDIFLRPAAPLVSESEPEAAETRAGASGTVLLAEDDEQIRELAAAGLRSVGYLVLEASNGREAVEISSRSSDSIDLILTDIVMPGLRGPELVEQALKSHPHARVVYISGYSDAAILKAATDSGAPLVHKPFKLQRLLEVVAEQMRRVEQLR